MALLRRLSDNFWSMVSPRKTNEPSLPTPVTDAKFKKPPKPLRRGSTHRATKHARRTSSAERVGDWSSQTPSSKKHFSRAGTKRKGTFALTLDAGRRSKSARLDASNTPAETARSDELDGDTLVEDEDEDTTDFYAWQRLESSPQTHIKEEYDDDHDMSLDNTLVVGEEEYTRDSLMQGKSRTVNLPEEHNMRHISTDELRAQGWDDDYITLIQKIAMRGFEPLLPAYWKFDYRFLPDGLFEEHDNAFISSVRGDHFRSSKAMEKLFELGGRVRDRVYLGGAVEPQEQVRRQLAEYIKWANDDAALDTRTAIPVLAIELQPAGTPSAMLRAIATRRCAELAARYGDALGVRRSIELPPPSSRSPDPASHVMYPLPTFYALVASYTLVALMAYNPHEPEPEVRPMAFFDFGNVDYDVWNSLALAITINHARNVQIRIAEETGLGLKHADSDDDDDLDDDPDA